MALFWIVATLLFFPGSALRKRGDTTIGNLFGGPRRQGQGRRPASTLPSIASAGCRSKTSSGGPRAHDGMMSIEVQDFEPVKRWFWLHAPSTSITATSPVPLYIALHGQTGAAQGHAHGHSFRDLGTQSKFISVYPQGMKDVDKESWSDQGTGWNDGTAGDNSTCAVDINPDYTGCYKSCEKLRRCGRCNWSTCYDDALFVKKMIEKITRKYCVDLARVYLQGESNGAQLAYHLIRRLPKTFAAVSPWYGQPLIGNGLNREEIRRTGHALRQTGILQLHLRHDVTIPLAGGTSDDGWTFEPIAGELRKWAQDHGCDKKSVNLTTKWDGGSLNFACSAYPHCRTRRQVMWCIYDGEHGTWPEDNDYHFGSDIVDWFFKQHARSHFSLELLPLWKD